MIELHTWTTPNGRKASIMLEELQVEYSVFAVDIMKGQQFEPAFLRIAPNNRIPAIVDKESGVTLMESGAILLYLADKHGRFIPEGRERWRTVEWLMWQMGGLGPMAGQTHHFAQFNPGISEYAEERYLTETSRLYGVLNNRLRNRRFIAGTGQGEYTIADIACWPWVARFEWQRIDLANFPFVRDWYLRIADRPAVRKGYQVPHHAGEIPLPT
ncbi:MAG: glutathione S-transferase N-terminal domain-containing protein [Rhodobacteraceae bacterium]|nr:glutathione S-transferase N-terminal domain-containing protein [Paracoccaceae bacterium]